jgi:hypothetical protein
VPISDITPVLFDHLSRVGPGLFNYA